MANRKSKFSKPTEKPGIDPIPDQDDLKQHIEKAIREDVARKYDAFLKTIIQIMADNHIIEIDVCHLIDHNSTNYPGYAFLELTPYGQYANYYDGTIKVENVLDVLHYLEEPKQILQSLIHKNIMETGVNDRIAELESFIKSEKAIKNLNITSKVDNRITNDKHNLIFQHED